MKIGVLDIQGSVVEHLQTLKKMEGVEAVAVKEPADMKGLKGLIIPGGESTTIGKLLKISGLRKEIIQRQKKGLAIWGTCAGAILLAKEVLDGEVENLALMEIAVRRNAYGRQIESFEKDIDFLEGDNPRPIPAVFIRAPQIEKIGERVEIVAMDGSDIVAVREGRLLASCFHPELTEDLTMHRYFVEMCT